MSWIGVIYNGGCGCGKVYVQVTEGALGVGMRERVRALRCRGVYNRALSCRAAVECNEGIGWNSAKVVSSPGGKNERCRHEGIEMCEGELEEVSAGKGDDRCKLGRHWRKFMAWSLSHPSQKQSISWISHL